MLHKRQKTTLPEEPIVQRIHVGGLASSVTPKELVARFSSFGEVKGGVQGVQGLGSTSSGLPRNYAFFDIATTQAKLQRCMSMLNGSMWKSHKLKIAPAKPSWEQRREQERSSAREADDTNTRPSATRAPVKPKKRKLSSDPNVGYSAKRFEMVTAENIENHKGWILDSKPHSSVPLFPLVVRPSHPIHLPPKAATTSWTRGKSSADIKKVDREQEPGGGGGSQKEKRPLTRIKRIRIDPRKYGRKKVVYPITEGRDDNPMIAVGRWECLDGDENEDRPVRDRGGKDEVTWVFKTNKTGEVKQREVIALSKRDVAHTDQFKALLEKLQLPECSKVKTFEIMSPTQTQDASPRTPTTSSSLSHELAKVPLVPATPGSPPMTSARARSLSPPPYIAAAPRQLLYSEEDAFHLKVGSLDDATRESEGQAERQRLLELAAGIVEAATKEGSADAGKDVADRASRGTLPKVEGFADESDDSGDEEVFRQQAALRLRGGGGVETESESGSEGDGTEEGSKSVRGADSQAEKSSLARESLKDMFKPREEESASFSLFSGLELELDEELSDRSPSPAPVSIPIPSALPPPAPRVLPVYRQNRMVQDSQHVHHGPIHPFFGSYDTERVPLSADRAKEHESRPQECGVRDWWKSQTQDEIDEEHARLRETLRGFSRKRHREAVKRTKKKVSAGREGGRRGGAGVALGAFTLDTPNNVADE
ncbi:hypothetical protein JCM16303_007259 [Sporobolomyces ruberrimus]